MVSTEAECRLDLLFCSRHSEMSRVFTRMTHIDVPTLPLQVERKPSPIAKCFAFMLGRALVRMSAVMFSVGQ